MFSDDFDKWKAYQSVKDILLGTYQDWETKRMLIGTIICAVNLVDCIDGYESKNNKYVNNPYYIEETRYHYIFDQVIPLRPYKMNGLQVPIYSHNTDVVFRTHYYDASHYSNFNENLPENTQGVFDEENPVWMA